MELELCVCEHKVKEVKKRQRHWPYTHLVRSTKRDHGREG